MAEDPAYLREQLITYIGNKRSLLASIEAAVLEVKHRLGRDRLSILDGFAGSGVVSRLFKQHADRLMSNDFETYSRVIAHCYLANKSEVPVDALQEWVAELNATAQHSRTPDGFIRRLYAPSDEGDVQPHERVFYTVENAERLDTYCAGIKSAPEELRPFLYGPLLSAASVHANTAGIFKGFYKDRLSRVGRYGGSGGDALTRIRSSITLSMPVLSRYECDVEVHQSDTNELVTTAGEFDLAYFDPPYNQHPYGSNYFMLNLLVDYEEPKVLSKVSGIPPTWRRSEYNVRGRAAEQLFALLEKVRARFVLLSYNSEGFIPAGAMRTALQRLGHVSEVQINYNAFRGSRNLRSRPKHVTEHLYLLDKDSSARLTQVSS